MGPWSEVLHEKPPHTLAQEYIEAREAERLCLLNTAAPSPSTSHNIPHQGILARRISTVVMLRFRPQKCPTDRAVPQGRTRLRPLVAVVGYKEPI